MVAVRCPHDYDSVMLKAGDLGTGIASLAYRAATHRAGDPRAAPQQDRHNFRAVGLDLEG